MSMLQSFAEFLVPVASLAAAYFAWRNLQAKGRLRTAVNAWEEQVKQTEILYAIEQGHADYMVEQDMDEKCETARQRIRQCVGPEKGWPNSDLTSPSGIRKQRERIEKFRAKLK